MIYAERLRLRAMPKARRKHYLWRQGLMCWLAAKSAGYIAQTVYYCQHNTAHIVPYSILARSMPRCAPVVVVTQIIPAAAMQYARAMVIEAQSNGPRAQPATGLSVPGYTPHYPWPCNLRARVASRVLDKVHLDYAGERETGVLGI